MPQLKSYGRTTIKHKFIGHSTQTRPQMPLRLGQYVKVRSHHLALIVGMVHGGRPNFWNYKCNAARRGGEAGGPHGLLGGEARGEEGGEAPPPACSVFVDMASGRYRTGRQRLGG